MHVLLNNHLDENRKKIKQENKQEKERSVVVIDNYIQKDNREIEKEEEKEEAGFQDMLDFVYGCKDDGSGDFCPNDVEIQQHKDLLKKEIVTSPEDNISISNVVGVYKDENVINGGKIENGLNGWDMVYNNYGTI
jgi:hypothetical protein